MRGDETKVSYLPGGSGELMSYTPSIFSRPATSRSPPGKAGLTTGAEDQRREDRLECRASSFAASAHCPVNGTTRSSCFQVIIHMGAGPRHHDCARHPTSLNRSSGFASSVRGSIDARQNPGHRLLDRRSDIPVHPPTCRLPSDPLELLRNIGGVPSIHPPESLHSIIANPVISQGAALLCSRVTWCGTVDASFLP